MASLSNEQEIDLQAAVDHPVDGIATTTTHSYDLDSSIASYTTGCKPQFFPPVELQQPWNIARESFEMII